MFDFQWPWLAVLFPLPWVVWRYFPRAERLTPYPEDAEQEILLHPALECLQDGFAAVTPSVAPHTWLPLILRVGVWGCLLLALMGPRLLEPAATANRGHDLMLVIDTSGSMKAMDFTLNGAQVSRMAVVKGVAGRFIESRRGDRIGLILFGDQAVMQAPLTLDVQAVDMLLRYAEPGVAGDGTAIGDAITLAVKKLKDRPEGGRVVVLVTDGENTSGMAPLEAARLALKYQVRVYAIGVGSRGQVPYPDAQGKLTYRDDLIIDDEGLTQITTLTGGVYFRATDTQGLERIYREIDNLEKTEAETRAAFIPVALYRWPLGIALLLFGILAWKFPEYSRRSEPRMASDPPPAVAKRSGAE